MIIYMYTIVILILFRKLWSDNKRGNPGGESDLTSGENSRRSSIFGDSRRTSLGNETFQIFSIVFLKSNFTIYFKDYKDVRIRLTWLQSISCGLTILSLFIFSPVFYYAFLLKIRTTWVHHPWLIISLKGTYTTLQKEGHLKLHL